MVKNSKTGAYWLVEEEFLKPVIKSPRECKSIIVNPEDLKFKVLMVHKDRQELRSSKVFKYIRWGEERGFQKRPTCANRKDWWNLEEVKGDILCMMSVNERHIWWENEGPYFIDARLYGATVKDEKYKILGRALNSTLFWLFTELWGRVNLGEGALDVKVYEYNAMPVLKLDDKLNKLLQNKISQRKINNIFEELGAKDSKEVSLDKVKPDRRELDKIVMGEILGLSDEEQLEVYQAVIDLVRARIQKAKSFGKKKKSKSGINIDSLVNTILEKIGDKTLKKFYKQKILKRDDLTTKKLPELKDKAEIKKGLFGWQLIFGKNHIDCGCETEARYLKIWLEIGVEKIKIPRDEKYLENVTFDLEKLKSDIDEIIENYLGSILDQKVKNQILHRVWQRIS